MTEHVATVETEGGPGLRYAWAACTCGWRGQRWHGPMAPVIAETNADLHREEASAGLRLVRGGRDD